VAKQITSFLVSSSVHFFVISFSVRRGTQSGTARTSFEICSVFRLGSQSRCTAFCGCAFFSSHNSSCVLEQTRNSKQTICFFRFVYFSFTGLLTVEVFLESLFFTCCFLLLPLGPARRVESQRRRSTLEGMS
jgi:hypothetical protein